MRFYLSFLILFFYIHCSSTGTIKIEKVESLTTKSGLQLSEKDNWLIISSANASKSFLSLPKNQPFLNAGIGEEEVSYRMAAFRFKEKLIALCQNQEIQSITSTDDTITIKGNLTGNDCNTDFQFDITQKSPKSILINVKFSNEKINRTYFQYGSSESEQFFGFGEQYSHFNLKGKKFHLFTEEQGIGRGDQPITFGANLTAGAGGDEFTSYTPIPHYITTENRSMFYENTSYTKFDLSESDYVKVNFWENGFQGTVWIGESPSELITLYTEKTGRFPELPEWAFGTWLGLQGGHDKAKKVVEESLQAGNPVTAIWIQDWVGKRVTGFGDQLKWRWYAQEKSENNDSNGKPEPYYPDFKNFCSEMNSKNIKVLGYINSFLADTNPKIPNDPFRNPMLEEAKQKGYLVKNQKGEDYLIETVGFPAYLIDLTNPEAVKWTKEIIKKNLIDVGLSGWMADFGEWLPYDAKLHSGISAKKYHNIYPVDWARINREAIVEAKKEGQIVFFTRAGYSYSNKYSTAFWLGDQMVSFQTHDGLPSTIVGLNSSGISGIAINHSDIGGYTGLKNPPFYFPNYDRTQELNERWAEANAFTPIFRTHEGNVPARFHQVYSDSESQKKFAKMGKIHYALKDYFMHLSKEAKEKGLPIVRHPYLNFPKDKFTHEIKYQFMLGEDLMVVPVVSKGQDTVKGYLPAGKWKHVLTGEIIGGGKDVTFQAPPGQPVALVKVGGAWSDRIFESIQKSLK
ncbi:MAG: alpha-glucosidase [Leptospiraceae bacterium]|nr:alpha-glucosidase [Leptospiraceae bacterium]MCP5513177.1 alpha-glucosidase [Leptospiraceae bacterium]